MSTGNMSNQGGSRHMPTGVSDEAYDLITTLSNKLQEMWRIDEFLADAKRGDRQVWEAIREHDRADVEQLAQALKRSLGQSGQ